jgi:hypothetical protein
LISAWLYNVLKDLNTDKKIKANGIEIPYEIKEIKRIIGGIIDVL